MLTQKTYSVNEVVDFKLTSGEELIARLIEDRPNEFIIAKPMSLVNAPNGGLGMMPIPLAAETRESVTLNKHAVAIHGRCQADLASQYLEKTTGLTLAKTF